MNVDSIFFAIEIIGTVAFAITGVITALEKKFDIFGALVLGTVTAVGGGIVRDIILGYLPPMAFRKSVYALTAVVTSLAVFVLAYFLGSKIKKHFDVYSQIINIFDSIGLSVFVIGGVNSAISCGFGENMFLSIFVATLTGVGGGVMRDIMAGRVPKILRKRVYALAAIVGAIIYYVLIWYKILPSTPAIIIGAGSVLVIRILATIFHWNLPTAKDLGE
ncbi:MAG: trimeric intracellular cation channel family protein [Clostridia bacterium]|nr:trimeric intracellular cation channel family protein [Clostridia bacterium]